MTELDVIKPVTEPTVTYVTKADGSLRMCLDPTDLNKVLKRGKHHIPTMEELAHKFSNAKYLVSLTHALGISQLSSMTRANCLQPSTHHLVGTALNVFHLV